MARPTLQPQLGFKAFYDKYSCGKPETILQATAINLINPCVTFVLSCNTKLALAIKTSTKSLCAKNYYSEFHICS